MSSEFKFKKTPGERFNMADNGRHVASDSATLSRYLRGHIDLGPRAAGMERAFETKSV